MFRELMPELADEYYLVAPDFPSFGQTESPSREEFEYSFDHLAKIVDKFTEQIGLAKFAMYVFDYGAPIGYRLAMWHPERITAIISQNGNMYEEGLGKKWEARKNCPTHCYAPKEREQIRRIMRWAGPRMFFYSPINAIRHLL